ncbi:MAG: DUF2061 domain-containing protein [Nitrosopumilaceae archaeon]
METQKRTLVKTVTYRSFTVGLLFATSWLYTGNFTDSSIITIVFNSSATAFYYYHERIWNKMKWGVKQSERLSSVTPIND